MLRIPRALIASLVCCYVCLAGTPLLAQGKNYALIIGSQEVDRYPKLKFCDRDADLIRKVLLDTGHYRPERLRLFSSSIEAKPYRKEILDLLKTWMTKVTDEDTVFFYYSGHGKEVNGETLLITRGTDPDNEAATGLPVKEVKKILQGGSDPSRKPARVIIVLDCCHAGAITDDLKSGDVKADFAIGGSLGKDISAEEIQLAKRAEEELRNARGMVTLASCKSDEKSMEYRDGGQGLFTHFLVKGLQGEADARKAGGDGNFIVDHLELYKYVSGWVGMTAKDLGGRQTPVYIPQKDTTGAFTVISLPVLHDPPTLPTPKVEVPKIEPPGAEAQAAIDRLQGRKSVKWDKDDEADVQRLLSELQRLTDGKSIPLRTPFFDRAITKDYVVPYLNAILEAYRSRSDSPPLPEVVPASLAIANLYARNPVSVSDLEDWLKLANVKIHMEPEFHLETPTKLRALEEHLVLAYAFAHSRGDEASQHQALLAYARLASMIRRRESESYRPISPIDQRSLVYQPAIAIVKKLESSLAADTALARAAGDIYGGYAILMEQGLSRSELEDLRSLADQAKAWNPRPEYELVSASLHMTPTDEDLALTQSAAAVKLDVVGKAVDQILARPELKEQKIGDDKAIALRLKADILARRSRLEACQGPIGRKINDAIAAYQEAISAFPQNSQLSEVRRLKMHYADCYLGLSSMQIDLANKVLSSGKVQERETALKAALSNARKFAQITPDRGSIARRNIGNAFEDLAYLAGNLESYASAIEIFAETTRDPMDRYDPQAWVDLARAQYKQAFKLRYGDALVPASTELEGLKTAEDHLKYALLLSDQHKEARWLLGLIALRSNNLDEAVARLDKLDITTDIQSTGDSAFNRSRFLRDLAELHWLLISEQVEKALAEEKPLGEIAVEAGTKPDFETARLIARRLPDYDPARWRILGEVDLLEAQFRMMAKERTEANARLNEAAINFLTSVEKAQELNEEKKDECVARNPNLLFGTATSLFRCYSFAKDRGLEIEGSLKEAKDLMACCAGIEKSVAALVLPDDERLRHLKGWCGIAVAKYDSNLCDPWLQACLPQNLKQEPTSSESPYTWQFAQALCGSQLKQGFKCFEGMAKARQANNLAGFNKCVAQARANLKQAQELADYAIARCTISQSKADLMKMRSQASTLLSKLPKN